MGHGLGLSIGRCLLRCSSGSGGAEMEGSFAHVFLNPDDVESRVSCPPSSGERACMHVSARSCSSTICQAD